MNAAPFYLITYSVDAFMAIKFFHNLLWKLTITLFYFQSHPLTKPWPLVFYFVSQICMWCLFAIASWYLVRLIIQDSNNFGKTETKQLHIFNDIRTHINDFFQHGVLSQLLDYRMESIPVWVQDTHQLAVVGIYTEHMLPCWLISFARFDNSLIWFESQEFVQAH